jgi:hypothetical protein
MSIRQFGFMTVVATLLILLGSVYQVGAAPPEPLKGSSATPEPAPSGAITVEGVSEKLLLPPITNGEIGVAAVVTNQGFEGSWPASNWTLIDQSSTDGGTYRWGKRNCHPHTGSFAGWSVGGGAQGGALPCLANYPNNVDTWAVYGPFNLANASSASLTYHFWGQTEGGSNCPFDYLSVMSSTDGQNFSGQGHCGDATGGPAGNGYYQATLNLSSRLGQNQVWIAFRFVSDFSNTFNGITIDDIVLDVSTGGNCPDAFETDNTFTTAKSIAVNGTTQTHNFHLAGDEDWVKFTITTGKVYTITTSNLGASNDTYMYLYDTNGTTILAQDDDSGPGLGSQIVWTAPSNGTYYVRVRHLINVGGCTGYNYDLAVTEGTIQLVAPTPLTAVPLSQSQIRLSWPDLNTIETGYKIERSPNGTSGWTQIATVGANVVTYTDTGLTCGTPYFYRVRAYNGIENSGYSNIANATPPCPPVAPANLIATPVSPNQINLAWQDKSNNEFGFRIERSPDSTSWSQIASVGPNVTSYANTGLACSSTYFYRVRAYNLDNSPYSNIANAVTASCPNINMYLPLIMKNFAPLSPPPPGSKPVDGHWVGTTSRSQPMSFDVSANGTVLNNFKLKTDFQVGPCSGTTETTVSNPRTITGNQFSSNSGSFTFSGQFNPPTSASGTYAYVNHFIPGCGTFNQSGTWTANTP